MPRNHAFETRRRPLESEIERPRQPRLNPALRVPKRRSQNCGLFAPYVAGIERAAIPSVVAPRVLPCGSVGPDLTDGADMNGAARAWGVSAMAGSRMAGGGRHSTTRTTTRGRLDRAFDPLIRKGGPAILTRCVDTARSGCGNRCLRCECATHEPDRI